MQLGYTMRVPMEVKFIYGHSCILGGSPADKQVYTQKSVCIHVTDPHRKTGLLNISQSWSHWFT